MGSTISSAFDARLDNAARGGHNLGWTAFAGDQSKGPALDGAGLMGTLTGFMQPSAPMQQMPTMQAMRPADFGAQQQAPQQAQMPQQPQMMAQPQMDLSSMQNMMNGGGNLGQQFADAGARQADEQRRRDYWQKFNQRGPAGLLDMFSIGGQ